MAIAYCKWCGEEFKTTVPNAAYCCEGHRIEARNAQARASYAKKKASDKKAQASAASKESRTKAVKTYQKNKRDVFIQVNHNVNWGRGWYPRFTSGRDGIDQIEDQTVCVIRRER